MIERQPHGRERRDADDERALHALGMEDGPLQRLHAADGAAQHQPQAADAERIEQPRLRAHVVADGNQRKVRPVDFAGFGIDRAGPRGAVTGAQHVDADDEVVLQRENRAGSEDLRPPGADQSRARERVANQNGIIPRRIQPAVDGVMQRGTDQGAAALERQGAVEHEVAFVGGLHGLRCGRRSAAAAVTVGHSVHVQVLLRFAGSIGHSFSVQCASRSN